MLKRFFLIALIAIIGHQSLSAQTLSKHEKMKWWREARFGMFIHFGTYAQWGGVYHGHNQARGGAEWIMNRAKIPVQEYIDTAKNFNPVKYNAEFWAKMAKDAGMKYLIITTKHHDGFALFDTKVSEWNALQTAKYGKDLIKPLAEACKKYGIKLGFYYSQSQDWVNPGGAAARKVMSEGWPNPDSTKVNAYTETHQGHWDPAQETKTFDQYINDVAIPQVKELLTNYGEIAVLWWDTPMKINDEQATKLQNVLKLQPNIITNDRLKRPNFSGDTKTPEQKIPDRKELDGKDWETCMTMNGSWGFKSWDHKWKSSEALVRNLIDIASKGGNYLLNIGPKPDGSFPQESIDRLKDIGGWMGKNKEAIYATKANPLDEVPWGRITTKLNDKKESVLYLSVFDLPKNGVLSLPDLNVSVKSATLLAGGQKVAFKKAKSGYDFQLATLNGKYATVIKVVLKEQIKDKHFSGTNMKTGELD
ncbi:alpha-L-fucosidase [Pseudopedobacter beijingensis]|uniref:alpha-L-fucosidase n=1 Tax=Pseudopedobacter beijingensis TaxID=1207056 RepID=A0ABW4IEK9_9SPHI